MSREIVDQRQIPTLDLTPWDQTNEARLVSIQRLAKQSCGYFNNRPTQVFSQNHSPHKHYQALGLNLDPDDAATMQPAWNPDDAAAMQLVWTAEDAAAMEPPWVEYVPFDPNLPYSSCSEYSQRGNEVFGLMRKAGFDMDDACAIYNSAVNEACQELCRRGRDPMHVGSKFFYLAVWRACLVRCCPNATLSFPLARELKAENTSGPLVGRAPSEFYMDWYAVKILAAEKAD
ncbi:hypothetical protein QBC39DRAFT_432066 [Podospora conica]|nr:hypothetical protein QBC39DRAFT_432066 [Schizothecium conicum]